MCVCVRAHLLKLVWKSRIETMTCYEFSTPKYILFQLTLSDCAQRMYFHNFKIERIYTKTVKMKYTDRMSIGDSYTQKVPRKFVRLSTIWHDCETLLLCIRTTILTCVLSLTTEWVRFVVALISVTLTSVSFQWTQCIQHKILKCELCREPQISFLFVIVKFIRQSSSVQKRFKRTHTQRTNSLQRLSQPHYNFQYSYHIVELLSFFYFRLSNVDYRRSTSPITPIM